jgi:hypothetical protein
MRQRRNEFCFGTTLEPEAVRPSRFQDFLNDFMKLIHFDRINTDIRVLIPRFFNSLLEGVVQLRHARSKQILKANQQGKLDAL